MIHTYTYVRITRIPTLVGNASESRALQLLRRLSALSRASREIDDCFTRLCARCRSGVGGFCAECNFHPAFDLLIGSNVIILETDGNNNINVILRIKGEQKVNRMRSSRAAFSSGSRASFGKYAGSAKNRLIASFTASRKKRR